MSATDPSVPNELHRRQRENRETITWLQLLGVEKGLVVCCVLIAALLIALALSTIDLVTLAQWSVDRIALDARVAVVVNPKLSEVDVEALKQRVSAVPGLKLIRLRAGQEVLADLDRQRPGWSASGAAAPPPQVWLLTPRGADIDATTVSASSAAIAAMPGIDFVRSDDALFARIDRARSLVQREIFTASRVALLVFGLALFGVFYLAGRGIAARARSAIASIQAKATAYIGIALSVSAVILAGAATGVVRYFGLQWIGLAGDQFRSQDAQWLLLAGTLAVSAILAIVAVLAAFRHSNSQLDR